MVCGGVGWHATLVWVAPVVVVGVFGHWCHPPRLWCQWCQSLWCWCPCPHPFSHSHTQAWHTTTPHTHTRLVAGPLWSLVCVCVCGHGVGCRRAWLATHTTTHSFCPTPLHQSSCCCCWWWWWMWWWQRGCCGVCGHLVHSLAVLVLSTPPSTHTGWWARGGGGCVCGVAATTTVRHSHQPPPPCPLPRPVRCVCVCACEW